MTKMSWGERLLRFLRPIVGYLKSIPDALYVAAYRQQIEDRDKWLQTTKEWAETRLKQQEELHGHDKAKLREAALALTDVAGKGVDAAERGVKLAGELLERWSSAGRELIEARYDLEQTALALSFVLSMLSPTSREEILSRLESRARQRVTELIAHFEKRVTPELPEAPSPPALDQ